jgi:hypothetical protein
VPEESRTSPKPVIAVTAIGLVPMLPVTRVPGVVVKPDLDKMASSTAVPRSTRSTRVALGKALGDTLELSLGFVLEEDNGPALGAWEAVGEALGDVDGISLGETEGVALGETLGEALGPALGEALGTAEGPLLGNVLGETEGVALGETLGEELG